MIQNSRSPPNGCIVTRFVVVSDAKPMPTTSSSKSDASPVVLGFESPTADPDLPTVASTQDATPSAASFDDGDPFSGIASRKSQVASLRESPAPGNLSKEAVTLPSSAVLFSGVVAILEPLLDPPKPKPKPKPKSMRHKKKTPGPSLADLQPMPQMNQPRPTPTQTPKQPSSDTTSSSSGDFFGDFGFNGSTPQPKLSSQPSHPQPSLSSQPSQPSQQRTRSNPPSSGGGLDDAFGGLNLGSGGTGSYQPPTAAPLTDYGLSNAPQQSRQPSNSVSCYASGFETSIAFDVFGTL